MLLVRLCKPEFYLPKTPSLFFGVLVYAMLLFKGLDWTAIVRLSGGGVAKFIDLFIESPGPFFNCLKRFSNKPFTFKFI